MAKKKSETWIKVPRYGEPQVEMLAKVLGKVVTPDETLNAADRAWLGELLEALILGKDVEARFTQRVKPTPKAELHFWIACDVAQHVHDKKKDVHALVAKRWRMDDADAKGADNIAQIVKRQRANTKAIKHLLSDAFARQIEQHRARLT